MNIHFPRKCVYLCRLTFPNRIPENHIARAEAMMIANTDNQYLVPTSGNPIRGLIQDHVVAGVWMTCQNTFFTREEYFQLLYGSLRPEDEVDPGIRIVTLPPTVWKPVPLWTGKQIVFSFSYVSCDYRLNCCPDLNHYEEYHSFNRRGS